MSSPRPSPHPDTLDDFTVRSFTHEGVERAVYEKGSGPAVLIMHEVPGITPEVAAFARRVSAAGYRVSMPLLFGVPGKPYSTSYVAGQLLRTCISREFHLFALRAESPITTWLRALCRDLHARQGGRGVGAVGMCLTGNFALALMVEPALMAPVLSQPSLPARLSPWHDRDLHISDETLAVVKQRAREGCPVLGLRFTSDPLVPARRFQRLRDELGDAFVDVSLCLRGHPQSAPVAHSVLTTELREDLPNHPTQQAIRAVLDLFDRQLRAPPSTEAS